MLEEKTELEQEETDTLVDLPDDLIQLQQQLLEAKFK